MEKKDITKTANEVFRSVGEIAKRSDFLKADLSEQDINKLYKQGYIERIRHGFYKMAGVDTPKEETILAGLIKQGIVCVESALFYYGYSDFAPRMWAIAVPYSFSRTIKVIREEVPVKAYYVQDKLYSLGATNGVFNGVSLPVYDRERTICDCFKYRTKLDNEIFNKAVNLYVSDSHKNLANLAGYAKEMGVYQKVINVMEVLLNG